MERFIRQHNDAVRQMLFPLHSNMERFILILPVHRQAVPAPFTSQYGEIRTFPHCISYQLSLALHSNMERFRCCLHYNYAFNFQISSKETQKIRKRGYHHLNHKVQMKLAPRRSSIKESSTEYFGYIFCFSYQEID